MQILLFILLALMLPLLAWAEQQEHPALAQTPAQQAEARDNNTDLRTGSASTDDGTSRIQNADRFNEQKDGPAQDALERPARDNPIRQAVQQ